MRRIVIETIPAVSQRYKTVGDWTHTDDTLTLRITDMGDDATFCVAVHELIEAYLCLRKGITAADVDAADAAPLIAPYEEHGDMPTSCYHVQHDFAWCIERMIAHELGLDWTKYADILDAAYDEAPKTETTP